MLVVYSCCHKCSLNFYNYGFIIMVHVEIVYLHSYKYYLVVIIFLAGSLVILLCIIIVLLTFLPSSLKFI